MKLKYLADINRRVLPESTDPDFEFAYIDISAVSGGGPLQVPPLATKFGSAPSRARRIAPEGSTIVSTVRTYLRAIAQVPHSDMPLVFSTGFAVLETQPDLDSRFMGYVCLSQPFIDDVVARSVGVSYPAINPSELGNIEVPCPSLEEQRRIADFLDAETARIDALAATLRAVSKKLTGRRQSLVNSLVTGRDLQPRSARGGLEWAGELPDCWPTVPLKYAAKIGSGHTPSRTQPEYWENCEIPWISLFDVGRMRDVRQVVMDATAQNISELGMENSSACLHPAGTVVLSRTASVGFSTIMGQGMAVSQHFVTWTCGDRLLPEYLLHLLRSMTQYFDSVKVGTTNVTVFMPDLHAIKIPLPSVEVQRSIISDIENGVAVIDSLSDAVERQINLLAERRQALITAAVTGQFDATTGRGADLS
ncbi:restriction endonuclease subunit S [Micromonospora arida]|uniref:restriction endonuclease subunit S n=1 Tax=Micromonospora arida TaxID=2203715 RepID=UPI0033E39260